MILQRGTQTMTWNPTGKTAITGIGASAFLRDSGLGTTEMLAQALREALDDCGLRRDQVDGLAVNAGGDFDRLAEQLGLTVRHANQLWTHGRMCVPTISQAALTVAAGLADHVACLYAIDISERGGGFGGARSHGAEEFREGGGAHGELPHYGLTHPASGAAMAWQKYRHRYSAGDEQLSAVAVTQRAHAALNPAAIMRGPMTVADHLASRPVVAPLRLFDCAVVNDGAVCLIVTTTERARDLAKPPVLIAGMQGLHAGREEYVFGRPGLGVWQQTETREVRRDTQVFGMAGLGPGDIDGFYCHDSFSPLVIFGLEEFGFCAPGEAGRWIADGHGRLGGKMPVNTNGGHLSEAMMAGWGHQMEIVRQLRGAAGERQIEGAEALFYGVGQGAAMIYAKAP